MLVHIFLLLIQGYIFLVKSKLNDNSNKANMLIRNYAKERSLIY